MTTLALVGGTIHGGPAERPLADGVVLVDGEVIAAAGDRAAVPIPRDAHLLDCSGLAITAGFWNSHVHFFERKWAGAAEISAPELARQLRDAFTRYGFTSVFDLSSLWENTRRIRDRVERGEAPGPRIRSTGEGLVPPGALPPELVLQMMGVMTIPLPEVAGAAQAAAAARKLLGEGVDALKLFASSPRGASLEESTIRAAADEAHRSGKPVFVHPNSGADVLAALRGGADIIAHTTPRSGPWDDATLAAIRASDAALTPTLALWKSSMRHDRVSAQERLEATAVAQLRAWILHGGTVLFGTDLGAVDPDPEPEYELMAEAGMGFDQILASLTTAPAARFGDGRSGRVAVGMRADLVALKGDPARDIRALAAVEFTVRAGKIVHRAGE